MMNKYKFGINRELPYGGYAFYIFGRDEINKPFIATNIKFETLPDAEYAIVRDPLIRFDEIEMRELAQELWRAGIRPEISISDTHLKALQEEIIYLRSIIDRLLSEGK